MIDHGYKRLRVSAVVYDVADIRRRMKQPHVIELAKSIRELGDGEPEQAPVIQRKTRVLVAGRDRMAAALLNDAKMMWFHLREADAPLARRIERHENLHRRPVDRDRLIAEEVAEQAKTIKARPTQPTPGEAIAAARKELPDKGAVIPKPARKPGRPKTPEGQARENVAAKLGTTADSVRKAVARAEAKAAPKPERALQVAPVDLLGLTAPAAWQMGVAKVCEAIDAADKAARAVQTALSKLDGEGFSGQPLPFSGAVLQQLKRDAHGLAASLRAARPGWLCPFCKDPDGSAGRRKDCPGCAGHGHVAEDKLKNVPAELLVGGAAAKIANGKGGFAPLPNAAKLAQPVKTAEPPSGWPAPKTPVPARNKIVTVGEDGSETAFDGDAE